MERPSSAPELGQPSLEIELTRLLTDRMRAEPAFRRVIELAGRWLLDLASAVPAEPHTSGASFPDPLLSNHDPGPQPSPTDAEASTNGLAHAEAPPEPSPAEQAPPDDAQLAELFSRFGGTAVSPIIHDAARDRQAAPAAIRPRRTIQSLEVYARRMELKADACAWAVLRLDESLAGNGFEPVRGEYERLRARANTMQPCFLWMIHADSGFIGREDWERLEGCYRCCAEVIRTVVEFPDEYVGVPDLLRLLGEAQSAIRAAMAACGAFTHWRDEDQQYVFEWCRDEGEARRVFSSFLSLDGLADPSLHAGLLARTRKLRERLVGQRGAKRQRRSGLNTIRYHLDQLQDTEGESDHHWNRIGDGIEEVLAGGTPASEPGLVELLIPVADEIPTTLHVRPAIRTVLRYVDERIAAAERASEPPPSRREPTPEVLRVREVLRGTTLVLIGGNPRPHSAGALEREFELAELAWLHSAEHQSISAFEPAIARVETRLVMIMIRWSSHSYEEVQEICERYGKIFVRLPGGYNPAQVAFQIIEQASAQLGIDLN